MVASFARYFQSPLQMTGKRIFARSLKTSVPASGSTLFRPAARALQACFVNEQESFLQIAPWARMDGTSCVHSLDAMQEDSREAVPEPTTSSKRAIHPLGLYLSGIPTFHSNPMTWRLGSLIGESL